MSLLPASREALDLLMEGSICFSRMEEAGLRIDTAYLDNCIEDTKKQIAEMETALRQDEVTVAWARHFGNKMNLESRVQYGTVVFDILGHPRNPFMGKRNNVAAFEHLRDKVPFIKNYTESRQLKKALNTYLYGIKRETVNGYCHPFYSLSGGPSSGEGGGGAESYRSSSQRPNFHNMPIRNKVVSKAIRSCVIPRPGHVFIEPDYGTQEVRVSYCYNKDPKLRYDILHGDMHTDRSKELYILSDEELGSVNCEPGKLIRYIGKNRFVFAQFYGSYFAQCAPDLWDAISLFDLRTAQGKSLFDHLAEHGIHELGRCNPDNEVDYSPEEGTFEAHVRDVEVKMWQEGYPLYARWKKDWWKLYQAQGGVNSLTGFCMEGVFRHNQILCDCIQGCLPGHVRVLTDKGHVPIKDLVGTSFTAWTGFNWVPATALPKGRCQLARVHLSSGIMLDCDTRHKFKNELDEWVDFKNLRIGDHVALPFCDKDETILPSEEITLPFVLGFIIGDGHLGIGANGNRKYVSITGGATKLPILKNIKDFLEAQGYEEGTHGGVHFRTISAQGKKKEKYVLSLENRDFAALLESKGMVFGCTAHTKRIPKVVWTMSWQEQRDFMEGLWLSDGSRTRGMRRSIHSPNLALLREVQVLISHLGFDSSIERTSTGHLLRVGAKATDGLQRVCSHRQYPRAAVEKHAGRIKKENYPDAEDQTDYRTHASAYHRKIGTLSQYVGQGIIERNGDGVIYRFDTVTKIEVLPEQAETYTVSVDDPLHQFVANGVICKNSAFHCLLWATIQIQKEFLRRKMKSKIVDQIHDSLLIDAHKSEVDDVVEICLKYMLKEVVKHWPWIIIPLHVEFDLAEHNWFDKHPLKVAA